MTLMTPKQVVDRARSAIGKKIAYKLGAGGMSPGAASPANHLHQCDCSGFTAWVLGFSRQTTNPFYVKLNQGWVNTDAIVRDANDCTGMFRRLTTPVVGCLVVYPSRGAGTVGHVGIVSAVAGGRVAKVIHCSSGNWRKYEDAIRETDPSVFQRPDAIFAYYEGIVD